MEIKFARVSKDVKVPSKLDENACFDVYAYFDDKYILVEPHETVIVPTGFHTSFSEDYVALLKERGSTGTKGIAQRSGVIDSGYRGEWMIPITNTSSHKLVIVKEEYVEEVKRDFGSLAIIYPYEKAVTQCLMVQVPKVDFEEISVEELKAIPSVRGEGKLGSTGK